MPFQENLTRLRKERGLSQEQLAERLGVSRQAVSKWETGEASPDLGNLLALAEALSLSLDVLCGRRTPETTDGKAPVREEAPAVPAAERPRRRWSAALSAAALIVGLLLTALSLAGLFTPLVPGGQGGVTQETADASLPDTITVSGVQFWNVALSDGLNCYCSPSVTDEACAYRLTMLEAGGNMKSYDMICEDGVCRVFIPHARGFQIYTAILEISRGEQKRSVTIAENVVNRPVGYEGGPPESVKDYSVSWESVSPGV